MKIFGQELLRKCGIWGIFFQSVAFWEFKYQNVAVWSKSLNCRVGILSIFPLIFSLCYYSFKEL
jgi:hypothetical protein